MTSAPEPKSKSTAGRRDAARPEAKVAVEAAAAAVRAEAEPPAAVAWGAAQAPEQAAVVRAEPVAALAAVEARAAAVVAADERSASFAIVTHRPAESPACFLRAPPQSLSGAEQQLRCFRLRRRVEISGARSRDQSKEQREDRKRGSTQQSRRYRPRPLATKSLLVCKHRHDRSPRWWFAPAVSPAPQVGNLGHRRSSPCWRTGVTRFTPAAIYRVSARGLTLHDSVGKSLRQPGGSAVS